MKSRLIHLFKIFIYLSKLLSRYGLNKKIKKFIHQNTSFENKKILFVGSGGALSNLVENEVIGAEFISIDIDSKRNPDFIMSVTNLKFEDNYFDYVFILEVLEHVSEPHKAVNEIERTLVPGGIVILSTPFIFGIHDEPYDYFRFTKYGLKYLFKNFTDVVIEERTGFLFTIIILISRIIAVRNVYFKATGAILTILLIPLAPLAICIDIILPKTMTVGYVLFGKKEIHPNNNKE